VARLYGLFNAEVLQVYHACVIFNPAEGAKIKKIVPPLRLVYPLLRPLLALSPVYTPALHDEKYPS